MENFENLRRLEAFSEDVLPEPIRDNDRIVLWLHLGRDRGFQCWERIASVTGAEVSEEEGIGAISATSIRARQQGLLGNLWQRFRPGFGPQAWTLPNGKSAVQVGARQTDLVLAWAKDETVELDEVRIKSCWPESQQWRKIGTNLYLVGGVRTAPEIWHQQEKSEATERSSSSCPQSEAEQMLAAARRTGDRVAEGSALIDLGIMQVKEGNAQAGVPLLEEALTIASQLGDHSQESDVLANLGLAVLICGQIERARQLLDRALILAHEAGDRFIQKITLDYLGRSYSRERNSRQATAYFEQALALARRLGDRAHQANLLWHLAIQHAELGERDRALANARAAIELFESMGNPEGDVFERYLQQYIREGSSMSLAGSEAVGADPFADLVFGGSISMHGMSAGLDRTGGDLRSVSGAGSGDPRTAQGMGTALGGPSLLRMAFSAVGSMGKFAGAGFKTARPETLRARLQTCASCTHHTGLRCKICGCFTNVKARMLHEDCPIGNWPARIANAPASVNAPAGYHTSQRGK